MPVAVSGNNDDNEDNNNDDDDDDDDDDEALRFAHSPQRAKLKTHTHTHKKKVSSYVLCEGGSVKVFCPRVSQAVRDALSQQKRNTTKTKKESVHSIQRSGSVHKRS